MMQFSFTYGLMNNNTYLCVDEGCQKAVLIDPSRRNHDLEDFLAENPEIRIEYILLTHGHFDHVWDAGKYRNLYGAKIAIHREDARMLEEELCKAQTPGKADILLSDGDCIDCGAMHISVLHTPGHTKGSVCFLLEDNMYSGDTLFYDSIGRTDLGGSEEDMNRTLHEILAKIERNYTVWPGHGRKTTLFAEQQMNRYLCLSK